MEDLQRQIYEKELEIKKIKRDSVENLERIDKLKAEKKILEFQRNIRAQNQFKEELRMTSNKRQKEILHSPKIWIGAFCITSPIFILSFHWNIEMLIAWIVITVIGVLAAIPKA